MPNLRGLICNCPECGIEFYLTQDKIFEREIEVDGEKLFLKFLTCPNCEEDLCVQLDNEQTRNLLKAQIQTNMAYAMKKFYHRSTKKQERKLLNISYMLIKLQKELKHKYDGSFYIFQNENKKINLNAPVVKFKQESISMEE